MLSVLVFINLIHVNFSVFITFTFRQIFVLMNSIQLGRVILVFSLCILFVSKNCSAQINPQDVTIIRDTFGVPHIYGITDADAAYGLAWAHSEDDFEHIQRSVVRSHGIVSE